MSIWDNSITRVYTMSQKIIAIIGGGPNLSMLQNYLKLLKNKIKKIKIIFFDKGGNFGYGNTHNTSLDKNILLNELLINFIKVFPYLKFPKN